MNSNEQAIQDREGREDGRHAFKWVKVPEGSCVRGRAGLADGDRSFSPYLFSDRQRLVCGHKLRVGGEK